LNKDSLRITTFIGMQKGKMGGTGRKSQEK